MNNAGWSLSPFSRRPLARRSFPVREVVTVHEAQTCQEFLAAAPVADFGQDRDTLPNIEPAEFVVEPWYIRRKALLDAEIDILKDEMSAGAHRLTALIAERNRLENLVDL